MKLYQDNGNFSPNAKRARFMCYEVGADVELVSMDFMKGEWKTPAYLALNPMGKVPTLVDDGYVVWESPAILYYLAQKFPEKKLLPADGRGMTEVLRWTYWNASHLEPAVFGVGLEKLLKPMLGRPEDGARLAACTADWERYAPILDKQMEGKTWALGEAFSIVDVALVGTLDFAVAAGLDVRKHRGISGWLERVTSRPAWKRTNTQ